jgi:hypothetical protein
LLFLWLFSHREDEAGEVVVLRLPLPLDRPRLPLPAVPQLKRPDKVEAVFLLAQQLGLEALLPLMSPGIGCHWSPRTGLNVCPLIRLPRECRAAAGAAVGAVA